MTLQFPKNPSNGQQYTASNNLIYVWDGEKWITTGSSGASNGYVLKSGDNMTGNLTLGTGGNPALGANQGVLLSPDGAVIATRTNSNSQVFIGFTEGESTATSTILGDGSATFAGNIQSTSQNGGQLAGFRNQLINGDFRVWQRATNFDPTLNTSTYEYRTADRWWVQGTFADNGRTLRAPNNGSTLTGCPKEFPYAFAFWSKTDTTNRSAFIQAVEIPFDTANRGPGPFVPGAVWTMSCYCSANIAGQQGKFAFEPSAGDSTGAVYGDLTNWTQIEAPTSTRWGRYSITFTGNNVSPALTDTCLRANFGAVGRAASSPNFTADSSIVGITGCQLEPGPVATPFEHRPIGTELALCQRYFVRLADDFALWSGHTAASASFATVHSLPVEMRALPTTSNITSWQSTSVVFASANIECYALKKQSVFFSCLAASQSVSAFFYAGADLDAEL